jgi:hypothetical protein
VSELKTITARAAEKGLSFCVAGGHAVITHGYARATFDLDLIIRRDDRQRWMELAAALGYTLHHQHPVFIQFNAPTPITKPLDLMLVSDNTFAELSTDAVPGPPEAREAKVVSLRHLLALKCHAIKHGHKGRIVKDADDVIRLAQANRLDLNDPELRAIFLKHGPPELYEKVKRICGES